MYRKKRNDPALPNAICPNSSVRFTQQNDNATADVDGADDGAAAATNTAQTDNDGDKGSSNGNANTGNNKDGSDGGNSNTSSDDDADPSFPRSVRPADYRLHTTTSSRGKRCGCGWAHMPTSFCSCQDKSIAFPCCTYA